MARHVMPEGTADRVQIKLLRNAGPARRVALCRSLSASVIALARESIRRRHPHLPEDEVALAFIETHYGKDLAAGVRRRLQSREA